MREGVRVSIEIRTRFSGREPVPMLCCRQPRMVATIAMQGQITLMGFAEGSLTYRDAALLDIALGGTARAWSSREVCSVA